MTFPTITTLRKTGWSLAAALLALPAIGMAAGWGFNWGPGDFLAAALLLAGAGAGLELAARLPARARVLAAAGVIAALSLIWVELAAGIAS